MYRELLGEKLRSARKKAGYTQKEIEELTSIKQPQLSKIEKGILEPNIELLGELIDFYEVSADWILGTGIKKTDGKTEPPQAAR